IALKDTETWQTMWPTIRKSSTQLQRSNTENHFYRDAEVHCLGRQDARHGTHLKDNCTKSAAATGHTGHSPQFERSPAAKTGVALAQQHRDCPLPNTHRPLFSPSHITSLEHSVKWSKRSSQRLHWSSLDKSVQGEVAGFKQCEC
ncbi:hypothetical protein A6R68_06774, partial [Neotoma lepida]